MSMLQQIAQQQPEMVLDRFVEVVNDLLPQFLPDSPTSGRGQEAVNPRLVRHYTTQGWLDRPLKQGREARYTYRHLLQLLVLRRLLAEGYSASSIGGLIIGQPNQALEDMLQGGVQLTVEAANPALAFLSQIRNRGESLERSSSVVGSRVMQDSSFIAVPPAPALPPTETWTRLSLLDGLELHIRHDVTLPTTAHERDRLAQLIVDYLANLNPP
jgi:DNA-binding transcriptional MerR regulator